MNFLRRSKPHSPKPEVKNERLIYFGCFWHPAIHLPNRNTCRYFCVLRRTRPVIQVLRLKAQG